MVAVIVEGIPSDHKVGAFGPDAVLAIGRYGRSAGKGVGALQPDLIFVLEVVDGIGLTGIDVATVLLIKVEVVGPGTAIKRVNARAAVQIVERTFAVECIVTGAAIELVIPIVAQEGVIAVFTVEGYGNNSDIEGRLLNPTC